MTRTLLSIGAALVLAAAALPTSASAQKGHGGGVSAGGFARGGGGAPNIGARAGGGAAMAAPRTGGGAFVAPRGAGAAFAAVPRGGGVAMAAPRAGGSWSGGHLRGRHHVRRGAAALGFAAPYYYDDATPYYSADGDCYQLQQVPTAWGWQYQRVYVCD
jgi:hypothetical protein